VQNLRSTSCRNSFSNGNCAEGEIIIWDTTSWKPIVTLNNHKNWILDIAWSSNANLLASASEDGTIIIWEDAEGEAASWQPTNILDDLKGAVSSLAWNFNSSQLATASLNGTVIVWETDFWEPVKILSDPQYPRQLRGGKVGKRVMNPPQTRNFVKICANNIGSGFCGSHFIVSATYLRPR